MSPLALTTLERSSHSRMLDQEEELLTFFHHVPQWLCYLEGPAAGARWLFPDGTTVVSDDRVAVDDELITRVTVVLSRGPTHNSLDGEHCCVVTSVSPSVSAITI